MHRLAERKVYLRPYPQLPRTVDDCRIVQFLRNTAIAAGNDDHVVHRIERRNDVHKKAVIQPDEVDERKVGNQATAEKHGHEICYLKK